MDSARPQDHRSRMRRRGVVLTPQGSRKLNQAKARVEFEQDFKRYTLEALSEETGLTPTTLSKVFTGSAGVDKRTLECCFNAFNLTLVREDYRYLAEEGDNLTEVDSENPTKTGSEIESAAASRNILRDAPSETVQNLSKETLRDAPRDASSETPRDALSETLRDALSETPRDRIHSSQKPIKQAELQPPSPTAPRGPMLLDSNLYIPRRSIEARCYNAVQQPGALLNIHASKQMGKTSLMMRILAHAKTLGYGTVSVNLQLADAEILQHLERLLKWFCARASKQLDLPRTSTDFWDNALGSKSNATDYFTDVLLANLTRPLVLAIDELNQLFAYPEIAREFLLLLRTWSEQTKARVANGNVWQKLRLVTVHSTEILIPATIDPSLLQTGLAIELPELTPIQVQTLARRCGQDITEQQLRQLIVLLGGHPYRLQLAFYHLQQNNITLEELLENSARTTALYAEHLQQQWWNLQRYPDLWPIFSEIVRQSSPVNSTAVQAFQMHKMGLVHLNGLQARLACELFRPFFQERLSQLSR